MINTKKQSRVLHPSLYKIYQQVCSLLDDLHQIHITCYDDLFLDSHPSKSFEFREVEQLKEIQQMIERGRRDPPSLTINHDYTPHQVRKLLEKVKNLILEKRIEKRYCVVEWRISFQDMQLNHMLPMRSTFKEMFNSPEMMEKIKEMQKNNPIFAGLTDLEENMRKVSGLNIPDNKFDADISQILLGIHDFSLSRVLGYPVEIRNRNRQLQRLLEFESSIDFRLTPEMRNIYEDACLILNENNIKHFTFFPSIFNKSLSNKSEKFGERVQTLLKDSNDRPTRFHVTRIDSSRYLDVLYRRIESNRSYSKEIFDVWTLNERYQYYGPESEPPFNYLPKITEIYVIQMYLPDQSKSRRQIPTTQKLKKIKISQFLDHPNIPDQFSNQDNSVKNTSISFTSFPISAALAKIPDFLNMAVELVPVNQMQEMFIEQFTQFDEETLRECMNVSNINIKSMASQNNEELNLFLQENDFPNIHIKPLDQNKEFGIVGVLDHRVEWKHPGENSTLVGIDGNVYDAAKLSNQPPGAISSKDVFRVFKTPKHSNYVVQINTKSGDHVYITVKDNIRAQNINDRMDLWKDASDILAQTRTEEYFGTLILPKIFFEEEINMDWIIGMQLKNIDCRLVDAKMQTRLRLNHKGARAQGAAVMISALCASFNDTIIIDAPFIIWFTHNDKITYVAYISMENWKDPGEF